MKPIVDMLEEDRATDVGNMHRKFGKDHACGSGDILVDRYTYSSHYFATTPMGEVKYHFMLLCNYEAASVQKESIVFENPGMCEQG